MITKLHRIDYGLTPNEIIEFIDINYPEFKGLCYYDDKELKSKVPEGVTFYFDPLHSVLAIEIK